MSKAFRDRVIDKDAPHRCGSCIYFEFRKFYDKPCKELGLAEKENICKEFIANTAKWTPVQRQAIQSAIRTMHTAGLTPKDFMALMYGADAKGNFGKPVYVSYGKDKVFKALVIRQLQGRSVIMQNDLGNIAIIDNKLIMAATPEITALNTDAFPTSEQSNIPQPNKRGRRKKGEEPQVPSDDILKTVQDSLSDSIATPVSEPEEEDPPFDVDED
jgi:hypothetical protein